MLRILTILLMVVGLFGFIQTGCTATPTQTTEPSPTLVPAATDAAFPTLRPTLASSSTPTPQIRITPLKPGETPWRILARDESDIVKLLTVHPTQPGWIYAAAGEDSGLIVSKDGGSTWQAGDLSSIDLIKVAPKEPMVVYAIAGHGTSLWKSNNGGLNFRQLQTPVTEDLTIAASHSGIHLIYLVGSSSKGDISELYRSDDGGDSWVFITQLPVKMGFKGDLFVDPTKEDHLYATLSEQSIIESGAFESWDGGVTWREVQSLKHLRPMKWILTQGQSPTAYVAVQTEQSDGQVPSYVAARPKSVTFPLPAGRPVHVFPHERFPEFGEFMVLDALFSDPDVL